MWSSSYKITKYLNLVVLNDTFLKKIEADTHAFLYSSTYICTVPNFVDDLFTWSFQDITSSKDLLWLE